MKGTLLAPVGLEDEEREPQVKWTWTAGGLWKMGMGLSCYPANKWGSQFCKYKKLNSANDLNEQGNQFSPGASRKGCSPADTLILAQ